MAGTERRGVGRGRGGLGGGPRLDRARVPARPALVGVRRPSAPRGPRAVPGQRQLDRHRLDRRGRRDAARPPPADRSRPQHHDVPDARVDDRPPCGSRPDRHPGTGARHPDAGRVAHAAARGGDRHPHPTDQPHRRGHRRSATDVVPLKISCGRSPDVDRSVAGGDGDDPSAVVQRVHALRTRHRPATNPLAGARVTRALRRRARLRRHLGLRSLPADVRRGPGRVLRGQHHARRMERDHRAGPARAARDGDDLPAPVGLRGRGDHHRPRVERPARAVLRRGVVRSGASGARHSVPSAQGTSRRVRGGRADRARPAHDGQLHVRRRALPGPRRDAPPAPGAAAASADLDRGVGRAADDADRGTLRGRLALLRPGRRARREVAAAERHGRRRRP